MHTKAIFSIVIKAKRGGGHDTVMPNAHDFNTHTISVLTAITPPFLVKSLLGRHFEITVPKTVHLLAWQ